MNLDNLFKSSKVLIKNDLVHNDIKPDNCVWDEKNAVLKYIDMGSVIKASDY